MAFTVTLYSFSKKENSTAVPADGTVFACVLKHNSGILNPVITLDIGTGSSPGYNYAYIPAYGRYYFIDEWTWVENRLWSAQMSVDVLATYKSEIGSSSLYVTRCASVYDGTVVDDLYPVTADVTEARSVLTMTKSVTGSYVVGFFGADGGTTGMINIYSLTDAQFAALKSVLFNSDASDQTTFLGKLADEIGDNLSRSIINPMQYIAFCYWFPYNTAYGTAVNEIPCGYFKINVSGTLITGANATALTNSGTVTLSKHPKAPTKGTYLNLYPYTRYCLFMHPYGAIDIDSSLLANETSIQVNEWIDFISGIGVLTVSRGSGGEIAHRTAQVGVSVPLSQSSMDILSLAGNVGLAAASVFYGDPRVFIGSIGNAAQSIKDQSMTMGSASGKAGFYIAPYLVSYHYDITDENITEHGRPLMQIRTISSLSGYIEVDHGDIATNGTAEENMMIKRYLEGGFYYE